MSARQRLAESVSQWFWWRYDRHSVRTRLLLLVLLPVLLATLSSAVLGYVWISRNSDAQLYANAESALALARLTLSQRSREQLAALQQMAASEALHQALQTQDFAALRALLQALQQQHGLLYARLLDPGGESLEPQPALRAADSPLLARARGGIAATAIELEAAPVAAQAEVLLRSIAPVFNAQQRPIALLDAGLRLSGHVEFLHALSASGSGPGNVAALNGSRVELRLHQPGNGAAAAARSAAGESMGRETLRLDVPGYVLAAAPLHDSAGLPVGLLQAGFAEPTVGQRLLSGLMLLALLLLPLALAAGLAVRLLRLQSRRLQRIEETVHAARHGKPSQRIGELGGEDELALLAREIDLLLQALQQRQQQLLDLNNELEQRVEQRTLELQHKNADLELTVRALREMRQQLVAAEKLAALGGLTAGVAHEINNPAQVILGNLDLLVMQLGPAAAPVQQEVDLIVQQVYRIQEIIAQLLQYARPESSPAAAPQSVDVNEVVERSMGLLQHLVKGREIDIHLLLECSAPIRMNARELEQVLVNLLSNAVHSLPQSGGVIEVATRNWTRRGVVIRVRDTGCGIESGQMENIFNPFYSSRNQGQGTGLGLSISHALVRRYGGNITVRSSVGVGSEFCVWLLAEPQMVEDEKTILEQLLAIERDHQ